MPDLRELRVFVAVAHQPSFTAAARALSVTQQSVSRVVASLEEEFGVVLVVRSTRTTRLTAAGELLATRAREMLRLSDVLAAELRSVGAGAEGAIRVGITHEVGEADRTAVVTAVSDGLRGARLSLHTVADDEIHRALEAGEVDLAVTVPNGVARRGTHCADLRPTRMSVYVLEDHSLADAGRASLSEFSGDLLMICKAPGDPYIDRQIAAFEEMGVPVAVTRGRVSGSMTQALTHLADLHAIGLLPAGTPTPGGVCEVAIIGVTFPLQLLWPSGVSSPAVQVVRDRLRRG